MSDSRKQKNWSELCVRLKELRQKVVHHNLSLDSVRTNRGQHLLRLLLADCPTSDIRTSFAAEVGKHATENMTVVEIREAIEAIEDRLR